LIGLSERTVRARNAKRAYLEAGSGPPIVLLHGIGSRAASWNTQLERWSARYRVVAWEAPGYGSSDDLTAPEPEAADYADALAELLYVLEIQRPIVVGHSLGALIAGTFAARYPDAACGLALLSVACGYGHLSLIDRERRFSARADDLRTLGMDGLAEKRSSAVLSPHASAELRARVRETMATLRESGYLAALRMLTNADLLAVTPKIRIPTLVACGAEDAVTPPEQNRRVAASIPSARFKLIERAGHAVTLERPDELDALLLPFFASVAGS
jgi:pimeloyl-ACP methyl ester carboxylesterase